MRQFHVDAEAATRITHFRHPAAPAPIVEHYGPAPGRGYVWMAGYQRWDGARYAWVPGRWERPPRPRAVWMPHRWVHRHGGWVLVEGHWR